MTGRRRPVKRIRDYSAFAPLPGEDMVRYAGKWVVAYQGEVRGVGKTLEQAVRRARLPEGAEPELATLVPAGELWYL